jgi:hypothetical protein
MATSGNFYVYEHWRLDRDECFYVGKGKGGRAYKMRDRNRFHTAIVQKVQRDGFAIEVKIVSFGLTEEAAFALEKERVTFWREAGADLANATNGGEGVSGLKMSAEARLKMRNAKLGTKQAPETVQKRIAPLIGRKQPRHAIEQAAAKRRGKKLSDEHRAKISNSHKGKIVSEAARKNLSEANKGHAWSPARRAAYEMLLAQKKEST